MPYNDYLISMLLKRKLEYKSIYMSSYVCPNIVMKALWKIYREFQVVYNYKCFNKIKLTRFNELQQDKFELY
jgi:hypothetical protein